MDQGALQDHVFREGEGDAWYRRNAASMSAATRPDRILRTLAELHEGGNIRSACEVGCATGWRLARLHEALPAIERRAGFDLSSEAIAEGRAAYPGLDLRVGTGSEPPFDERFDLVIVSFVLHWIDRSLLARSLASIDGLVAPGGWLVVADFLPDLPSRRRYHHRQDVALYTYKQDYARCFTGMGLYREIGRSVFDHADHGGSLRAIEESDRAVCALLHKPLQAYREQT